jgi:hypothetical protein
MQKAVTGIFFNTREQLCGAVMGSGAVAIQTINLL